MFTIIICRQEIIDDCKNKYNSFLKPLMSENYDFASWNTSADNLDEAVPALQDYIKVHKDWRAVIVCDHETVGFDGIKKENPFDICGYVNSSVRLTDKASILEFRQEKEKSFDRAIDNPLVKISNWLLGANIIDYEDPKEILNISDEEVDDKYFERVEESAKGLYQEEKILAYELNRERIKRDDILLERFGEESVIDCAPKQVILLSERAIIKKNYLHDYSVEHLETEYSQFYEDNLYPAKVRFLLYDIKYLNGHREADDYFAFLVFLNVFANYQYPNDTIKPERVYCAKAVLLEKELKQTCNDYLSMLKGTERHLHQQMQKLDANKKGKLDNRIVESAFEEDITVPVTVNSEFLTENLFCSYREIGPAKDYPIDEVSYWKSQYDEIEKQFVRYIREPKRAIKTAVRSSLRANNALEDERAMKLDEFQQENIYLGLLDREEKMVGTHTGNLFNSEKYKEKIETADKEVRKRIGQRMTLRKTIISSMTALLLFLISSAPFVVEAYKHNDGESLSWIVCIIGIMCFACAVLIAIFAFKRQLINKFKHFNSVMSEIVSDIEAGLKAFSLYISYVCNVMRRFSILNYVKSDADATKKIILKHKNDISKTIEKVYKRYPSYASDTIVIDDTSDIYNCDFKQMGTYQYDMLINEECKEIEFLQNGNQISVPVKYIDRIVLSREELYE